MAHDVMKGFAVAGLAAVALAAGCHHQVDVDVKHVAPIEATVNVNLKVERDLDDYFAYESPDKYPLFNTLKDQGKIGETYQGYVEAVNPADMSDQVVKTIVEGANNDRRMIYGTLAKQQSATVDAVADRNAVRNFANATSGQWLKTEQGWRQKS